MDLRIKGILRDNDMAYLNYLSNMINNIDSEAEIIVIDSFEGIIISVLPTLPQLRDQLVRTIRKVHYNMNLSIEFSKSLLISRHITFKVKIK